MDIDHITYRQLNEVLLSLGFTRRHVEPKWRRYDHAPSDTVIIVIEKRSNQAVRISDAISVRIHLVEKGLITQEELARRLAQSAAPKKVPSTKAQKSIAGNGSALNSHPITYQQLDDLLLSLNFTRRHAPPKWRCYDHVPSDTMIVVVEKGPKEPVRITDALSARLQLVEKGLITEEELEKRLAESAKPKKPRSDKEK